MNRQVNGRFKVDFHYKFEYKRLDKDEKASSTL
jgi:hypothetical protein